MYVCINIYIYIFIPATVPLARSGVSLMYLIVPWTPGPLDSEIPKGLLGARTQLGCGTCASFSDFQKLSSRVDETLIFEPQGGVLIFIKFSKIELSSTRNANF